MQVELHKADSSITDPESMVVVEEQTPYPLTPRGSVEGTFNQASDISGVHADPVKINTDITDFATRVDDVAQHMNTFIHGQHGKVERDPALEELQTIILDGASFEAMGKNWQSFCKGSRWRQITPVPRHFWARQKQTS